MPLGISVLMLACGLFSTIRSSPSPPSDTLSLGRLKNVSAAIDVLLEGYDIRLRPSFGGQPLIVEMDLEIASFDSISEVNMDYTVTLYLNQYWKDERLAFSDDSEHMTLTSDFAEKIWVPDTFFANDKNSFLHDVTEKNKMVRLRGDGHITYGMRFTTTLACMMDLHHYPLDSQNCTVEIESYGYTTDDVVMMWKADRHPVRGVEKVQLPQFKIIEYRTITTFQYLATGNYNRLSLSFRLQRSIGYFIFQTYLPSILIVMLSWVSFWINHEATSARVALGITTVLTMTTISTGVRSSLPRISYVKAIDIYLVMCFVFVFTALLEYAAVNYTYWEARAKKKKKKDKREAGDNFEMQEMRMSPIPSLRNRRRLSHELNGANDCRALPTFRMSPIVRGSPYLSRSVAHSQKRLRQYLKSQRREKLLKSIKEKAIYLKRKIPSVKDVNTIDKFSRFIFPALFGIFNTVYWCFYLL